jgi:cytochrome b subunit of formate dehydrogenase
MSTNKMKSAIGDLDSSGIESTVEAVYVYEAPVRLWHWVNAGAITVLAITGYFIGSLQIYKPQQNGKNEYTPLHKNHLPRQTYWARASR